MQHVCGQIIAALTEVPAGDRGDLYVVGVELATESPDERRVTATVAWNTRRHLEQRQGASSAQTRSRWEWSRFGFVEPEARVIAGSANDPMGAQLRRAWLEELGLWYADEMSDFAVTDEDPQIWDRFVSLTVDVVRHLHKAGELRSVVGHDVPVLLDAIYVNEDRQIQLNRMANPAVFHERLDRWAAKGLLDP
jgi:hypothetical protein